MLAALYILTGLLLHEDINGILFGLCTFGLFGLIVFGIFEKSAEDNMNRNVRMILEFDDTE